MNIASKNHNKSIIPIFYELGEGISNKWKRHNYSEDALVNIAAEELNKAVLHKYISPSDIINLSLQGDSSIRSYQVDSPFGDLQQITYRHPKFYIEVLYWCDGSTAIHDHGFSGAFCVLSGSSINAEYMFNSQERVNHRFSFGRLSAPSIHKLNPGDVRKIYSGKRFIHSVFHLENPTISIVVRTLQDDDAMPQCEYRGGRIRLVEIFEPDFAKRIQGLRFISQSNKAEFVFHFKNIFRDLPLDERYWFFRAFYQNIKQIPELSDLLTESTSDQYTRLIMDTIEDESIIYNVMKLRTQIKDPHLQYFLALLLNIPSWVEMEQFVKRHHTSDSSNIIREWLLKTKSLGLNLPNKSIKKLSYLNTLDLQETTPTNIQNISMGGNSLSKLITKRIDAIV